MDNTTSGILQIHEIYDDILQYFPHEDPTKINIDWDINDSKEEIDYPQLYKEKRFQEIITDEEKQILELKVRLHDGNVGHVVTSYQRQGSWFYYCHLCQNNHEGWEVLKDHINTKNHKVILSKTSHGRNKFLMISPNDDLNVDAENLCLPPCNIQKSLDQYNKPMVGLEYLVESEKGFNDFDTAPQYYCLLCDTLGNNKTILVHMSSENHYLKFFLMFFPSAMEKLRKFAATHINTRNLITAVIEHVAAKIETEYGRLKPLQVERVSFDQLKFKILSEIDRGRHIRETKEKTFEECVCLTHVHVSVCQVLPYQEKGLIEAKKQNMWKNSVSGSSLITNKIDDRNQLYNRVSVQITNRPETSSNQIKRLNPAYKQVDGNKRIKLINGATFNTSQAHVKSAQTANLNANHFQGQGLQKTFNNASGSQNVSSINNHNFVFKKINSTNPNSGNNIQIVHQQGESIQIGCPILNQNLTSSQIISSRATKIVVQNNLTNTSHISSEMHLPRNTNQTPSFINMFKSNRSQASSGIALPFQANQNPHFINMVQTSISQTSPRNPLQFQTNRISSFLVTSQTNKSQTSSRIPTPFQAHQNPSFINNNRFQSSHRAVLPFQISQTPSFLNIVQNNTTQTTPRMSLPHQINLNSSNTSSIFNNLSKPR